MPHVNAEQAKVDVKAHLDKWMIDCVKKGGKGHATTHGATNTLGTGYTGASESNPATILQTEWITLKAWWSSLMLDVQYNKWTIASFGGGNGVEDLCCSCNACPQVEKKDFNSPTGKSQKIRTFVYHLKIVQVAPVEPPKPIAAPAPVVAPKVLQPSLTILVRASSNDEDDSLLLDYKVDAKGTPVAGKLDKDGKAKITLPAGIKLDDCKFGFQGASGTPMDFGKSYLLPGGRYMVELSRG